MHAISTILFEKPAYKNVICAGFLLDKNGEKMSKSKGNIIDSEKILNEVGVDAVRLQMCIGDPGNSKRFSIEQMKESVLPFLTVIYNCKTFYEQSEKEKYKKQIEDEWILSRLNTTILETTKNLEDYELDKALEKIIKFTVNDFSRTYIKITRERNDKGKILEKCLREISLMLAPYAPHISEYIFQIFDKKSVHLSPWPKVNKRLIDKNLEINFEVLLEIIEKGFAVRDK
jgi:isoleucyl-tRNA synthetase